MPTIMIDAESSVLGRIASFAAKKAMEGEKVIIVNSEKAIISGNFDILFEHFKQKVDMRYKGDPSRGSHYSRMPDKILKQAIEGMLPHKKAKGRTALKNVRVYIGVPADLAGQKFQKIPDSEKSGKKKFFEVSRLSKQLGAEW